MALLDGLPILIQIIHDRDGMSRKKALRFSRRRYWPYRAIAAGNLIGSDYTTMVEREKDLRVVRQLVWNPQATATQLQRLLSHWFIHGRIPEDRLHRDVLYAIANHENSSLETRVQLRRFGWRLDFDDYSTDELASAVKYFHLVRNPKELALLERSDLVDMLETL